MCGAEVRSRQAVLDADILPLRRGVLVANAAKFGAKFLLQPLFVKQLEFSHQVLD